MIKQTKTVIDNLLNNLKNDKINLSNIMNTLKDRENNGYYSTNIYFNNENNNLIIKKRFNSISLGSVSNITTKEELKVKLISFIEENIIEEYTYKILDQSLITSDDIFINHTLCLDDIYDLDILISMIFNRSIKDFKKNKKIIKYLFDRLGENNSLFMSTDSLNKLVLIIIKSRCDKYIQNNISLKVLEYIQKNIDDVNYNYISILMTDVDFFINILEEDLKKQLLNNKNYVVYKNISVHEIIKTLNKLNNSDKVIYEPVVAINSIVDLFDVTREDVVLVFNSKDTLKECFNFLRGQKKLLNKHSLDLDSLFKNIYNYRYIVDMSLNSLIIEDNYYVIVFKQNNNFKIIKNVI